jgi:hypothetical protein
VGAGAFTLTPSAGLTATVGTFRVPTSVPPGTYEIVATCSDRRQVTGQLAITPAAAEQRTRSLRHALAYLGGLLSPDLVRTAGGIALGAAAARITWVLHRRVRRNEI